MDWLDNFLMRVGSNEGTAPKGARQYRNLGADDAYYGTGKYSETPQQVPPLQNYNPRPDYQDSDIVKRQMEIIEQKKKQGPPPEMLRGRKIGVLDDLGFSGPGFDQRLNILKNLLGFGPPQTDRSLDVGKAYQDYTSNMPQLYDYYNKQPQTMPRLDADAFVRRQQSYGQPPFRRPQKFVM